MIAVGIVGVEVSGYAVDVVVVGAVVAGKRRQRVSSKLSGIPSLVWDSAETCIVSGSTSMVVESATVGKNRANDLCSCTWVYLWAGTVCGKTGDGSGAGPGQQRLASQ